MDLPPSKNIDESSFVSQHPLSGTVSSDVQTSIPFPVDPYSEKVIKEVAGNSGVTHIYPGTGISVNANVGDVTITNLVTAPTDATLSTSDITTNNVSTSKHGFAPKAPNDATKYLNGVGAYSVPASGALYSSASGSINDNASTTITWGHGLGVVPKFTRMSAFAYYNTGDTMLRSSIGVYNGTVQNTVYTGPNSSNSFTTGQGSGGIFFIPGYNGGYYSLAGPAAVDSTNVTITITISGTGQGVPISYLLEAYA